MSPIHRHPSTDSLGSPLHSGVSVSNQSMPQLQAMASGGVMMSTNGNSEVSYQYVNGYGNSMGENTGSGLVSVPSMDSHGMYSRGSN